MNTRNTLSKFLFLLLSIFAAACVQAKDFVNQEPSSLNRGNPRDTVLQGIYPLLQQKKTSPSPSAPPLSAHFTATVDMRWKHITYAGVLDAINDLVGDEGLFHISPGDIDDTIRANRDVIDAKFGADAVWIAGIGNHEAETGEDMEWLRTEYATGHSVRRPLRDITNGDGPTGTEHVNYSWDDQSTNSHYILLNQYWNGGNNEGQGSSLAGDDTATDGDTVSELRDWLEADLAANRHKAIFVFGHEPAFPQNRHVGTSLDKYQENRDAFWALLEKYGVEAYICGHTHFYSARRGDGDGNGEVWQIDLGNAGNGSVEDGLTFLDVVLLEGKVRYNIYRGVNGRWHLAHSWSEDANITMVR